MSAANAVVAPTPATGRRRRTSSPWLWFVVRRAQQLVVSLWVLITASFLMIHLIPGDPVRAALGPTAPASLVAAKRAALHLNDPLLTQYWLYFKNLLSGDLGTSVVSQLPVSEIIGQRLPATLALAAIAFLASVAVSVPLGVGIGVLTRRGRGRRTELVFTTTSVVLGIVPDFLIGVILVFVFGVSLSWLPVAGDQGPSSYILPVIALAAGPTAVLARIIRVEMVTVLETDYMRTARAKRLPSRVMYLGHALPNAITSALTIGGLFLGAMVASTVLVENVFAWPGLGSTITSSILDKDYQVAQAIVLVYGVGVLLANTLVDVLLAVLDPRSLIREA